MKKEKLQIVPKSESFWWSIYGFTREINYENIDLIDTKGNVIYELNLNTRTVFDQSVEELKSDLIKDDIFKNYNIISNKYYKKCINYYYLNDEIDIQTNKINSEIETTNLLLQVWHSEYKISTDMLRKAIQKFLKIYDKKEFFEVEFNQNIDKKDVIYSYANQSLSYEDCDNNSFEFDQNTIEYISDSWMITKAEVLKIINKYR